MKFSILIPVYNDEEYLKQCLDSVVNQSYENIEIVIVNDGSTDKSIEVINDYAAKDKRIKVITQDNQGVCKARNKLIENASGEYVLFLDADDYIDCNLCSEMLNIIKNYNPDLITFDYTVLYSNSSMIVSNNDKSIEVKSSVEVLKNEYLFNSKKYDMVLWRRCYKNDIIKSVKFLDGYVPEDYFTAFEIYEKSNKIVHISKSLYNYRARGNGLTVRKNIDELYGNYLVDKKVYKEELEYFKNSINMQIRVRTIYINSLLHIYSKCFFMEDSIKKEELKGKVENEIKQIENYKFETKTSIMLAMYKINKLLVIYLLKFYRDYKFKRRNKS